MCFYNEDYDWTVSVQTDCCCVSHCPATCFDCNRPIAAGEWRLTIYQQEYEMCQVCEDEESDDYISGDEDDWDDEDYPAALARLAAHSHSYGETWYGEICRECCLIRESIYDLEEKEGCPEYARQPAYGDLLDVIHEDQGKWGDRKYTSHAIGRFPELAEHFLRF